MALKKCNYELNYSRLKELRINNNITQNTLANLLEIDFSTYSHYEKMDVFFPIEKFNILANYFDVSLDYLVFLSNDKNYSIKSENINRDLIAKRLKDLRKENNLYQETLAMEIGTSKSLICEYEKGKKLLSLLYAFAICKKYNISMDYLYGKVDSPKYLK